MINLYHMFFNVKTKKVRWCRNLEESWKWLKFVPKSYEVALTRKDSLSSWPHGARKGLNSLVYFRNVGGSTRIVLFFLQHLTASLILILIAVSFSLKISFYILSAGQKTPDAENPLKRHPYSSTCTVLAFKMVDLLLSSLFVLQRKCRSS